MLCEAGLEWEKKRIDQLEKLLSLFGSKETLSAFTLEIQHHFPKSRKSNSANKQNHQRQKKTRISSKVIFNCFLSLDADGASAGQLPFFGPIIAKKKKIFQLIVVRFL